MGFSSDGSNRARMGATNMAMQARSTRMEVGLILPAMKLLFFKRCRHIIRRKAFIKMFNRIVAPTVCLLFFKCY